MKKEVEANRSTLDLDIIFDDKTSLTQVIDTLSNIYNDRFDYTSNIMGVEVVNCRFETNYHGYEGGMEVELIFYRMETDKEYDKRLLLDKKKRDALKKKRLDKEKRERAQYERLKKIFGEIS